MVSAANYGASRLYCTLLFDEGILDDDLWHAACQISLRREVRVAM